MIEYKIIEPKCSNFDEIYDFIAESDNSFQPTLSSRVNLKDWVLKLHNNATLIEVRDNTRLIGLSAAYINKSPLKSFGTYVYVQKEYQKEFEIGPTAISMMVDYSERYGSGAFYCTIRKSNKALWRFYKSLGFVIEEIKTYPNSDIESLVIIKYFKNK